MGPPGAAERAFARKSGSEGAASGTGGEEGFGGSRLSRSPSVTVANKPSVAAAVANTRRARSCSNEVSDGWQRLDEVPFDTCFIQQPVRFLEHELAVPSSRPKKLTLLCLDALQAFLARKARRDDSTLWEGRAFGRKPG